VPSSRADINPPAKKRRHYWVGGQLGADSTLPGDPEAWLAAAVQQPGSWWPDWSAWLAAHSGERVRAPAKLGNARFKPVEAAPGGYVKVRAV
jgi:polyhydroxyalkanoate synthase